jgi:hypothetical protein
LFVIIHRRFVELDGVGSVRRGDWGIASIDRTSVPGVLSADVPSLFGHIR